MSIQQILVVMLYTLKPYLWLLGLVILFLLVSFVLGRKKRGPQSAMIWPVSGALGLAAALAAPMLTGSQLAYVVTTTDWLALMAVGVGATLYAYLLLRPLWRKR